MGIRCLKHRALLCVCLCQLEVLILIQVLVACVVAILRLAIDRIAAKMRDDRLRCKLIAALLRVGLLLLCIHRVVLLRSLRVIVMTRLVAQMGNYWLILRLRVRYAALSALHPVLLAHLTDLALLTGLIAQMRYHRTGILRWNLSAVLGLHIALRLKLILLIKRSLVGLKSWLIRHSVHVLSSL